MTTVSAAGTAPARPGISFFERYLSLWVVLCIVAGIALGHALPGLFGVIASAEVARVNLVVAVLIWLMIVNGRRRFRKSGHLKFPSLAGGFVSVISRDGDRAFPLLAGGRAVSARAVG